MQIEIATLFPEMCEAVLSESIIGRARKAGHNGIYVRPIVRADFLRCFA